MSKQCEDCCVALDDANYGGWVEHSYSISQPRRYYYCQRCVAEREARAEKKAKFFRQKVGCCVVAFILLGILAFFIFRNDVIRNLAINGAGPEEPPGGGPKEPPTASKPGQEVSLEIAPDVTLVFCWVPPGKAQLGAPEQELVNLAKINPRAKRWMDAESEQFRPSYTSVGFWLGKYEVTQTEWAAVMGANPSVFDGKNANKAKALDTSRFPVENVSWNDCQDFLKRLNAKAGAVEKTLGTYAPLTLPHEDEWEFACRGGKGNGQPFHFGAVLDGRQANCDGTVPWGGRMPGPNLGRPTTVGSYGKDDPHPWGLCDMHGNVEEWCENTQVLGEVSRVLRGGAWAAPAWVCRSANRSSAPSVRSYRAGLRVCVRVHQ